VCAYALAAVVVDTTPAMPSSKWQYAYARVVVRRCCSSIEKIRYKYRSLSSSLLLLLLLLLLLPQRFFSYHTET
jgi:hypothetical protein